MKITAGKATGPLIGGNLTMIATLMGTPYQPDTTNAIVFLEDVHEEPYRIDRMLTALALGGSLALALLIMWLVELLNRSEPQPAVVLIQPQPGALLYEATPQALANRSA